MKRPENLTQLQRYNLYIPTVQYMEQMDFCQASSPHGSIVY